MVYEEEKQQIVYKGEVAIRQGDIRSKSPEATVQLSADGSAVQTLVAGEPVEVVQGDRKGVGARGTYTPDRETFLLVGEKVTVNDPTQQVEGRSLTFHVGDDRILVDGREEVRTESIFKRTPPKK
jgi:lipopolysaccharide transport protein LptA